MRRVKRGDVDPVDAAENVIGEEVAAARDRADDDNHDGCGHQCDAPDPPSPATAGWLIAVGMTWIAAVGMTWIAGIMLH